MDLGSSRGAASCHKEGGGGRGRRGRGGWERGIGEG